MKKDNFVSYDEIIEEIKRKKPCHLLIGNGFSIAFDECFGIRENTLEEVGTRYSSMFSLGTNVSESDNESISSSSGKDLLRIKPNLKQRKENYPNVMFWEVARKHPTSIEMIRSSEAKNCVNFIGFYLNNGGKVFTTNYDMLLYWSIVKGRELEFSEVCPLEYVDGFTSFNEKLGRVYWNGPTDDQNIFYCHGAMNLDASDGKCFRHMNDMLTMSSVISEFFDKKKRPLVVSAEKYTDKLDVINQNQYLKDCIDKLANLSGSLVVIGLSLTQNDDHIVDALASACRKNKLRVYYGYFEEEDKKTLKSLVKSKPDLKIKEYFYSGSANIWRESCRFKQRRKYDLLEMYLKKSRKREVTLSFDDIENVIGGELPKSARMYAGWWDDSHSHSSAWINAGYKVKVDMKNKTVKFTKRMNSRGY